jgi:lipopolysaccharide exporter
MEYRRIFRDGAHLLAGRVGTMLIGVLDLMLLARILSTEEMGKYSLFLMVVNLALIVGLNWSDSSVVRHGREEFTQRKSISQSFWARMYLFIPIIIIISLLLLAFGRQITDYVGIEPGLIYIVITMFALNGLLNFVNSVYQSTDRMKKSAYVQLSQKAIYMLCLGFLFLGYFRADLTIVLILINVSFLLALALNLVFFDFSKIFPYTFHKEYFKRIWSYSWPQLVGFPGLYIVNYIDLFVIKKYMTLRDVGVYSVAYNTFMNISMIIMILYTVFFPIIVEYKTKGRYDLIRKYLGKIPLFTGAWVVIVLVGILISGYALPLIFSAKYAESVPSFNILLVASVFYFVSIVLLPVVNAFDLILYSQIINLVKAIVNIVADFFLVTKIGIIGAAYGTLVSYAIGLVLTLLILYFKRDKILVGAWK